MRDLGARLHAAEALCARLNAELDQRAATANTASDLRRRSNSSKEYSQEDIERERHTRRSTGGCGKVAVLEDTRDPGTVAAARLPCRRKTCPDCGPRERAAIIRHYSAMMGDTPVVRRVMAAGTWRSVAAKLRRAGAQHLRIPAPGGKVVVYSTAGPGEVCNGVPHFLAADIAAAPAGGRITSSREWARQPVAGRGDGRWKLLGMARVPLAKVVQAARDLDLYVGELQDRALPAGWAEAHLLRRGDDLAWRRFRRWAGLHWPERRRRGQARAA